jgi:hypothetical protein
MNNKTHQFVVGTLLSKGSAVCTYLDSGMVSHESRITHGSYAQGGYHNALLPLHLVYPSNTYLGRYPSLVSLELTWGPTITKKTGAETGAFGRRDSVTICRLSGSIQCSGGICITHAPGIGNDVYIHVPTEDSATCVVSRRPTPYTAISRYNRGFRLIVSVALEIANSTPYYCATKYYVCIFERPKLERS